MKNKTYELLYDTQAQFNQAQGSSGNVTSVTPAVAYVVENTNTKYNRYPSVLTIVYEVDDISEPTKLFNADAVKNNLKLVFIDKEEVPVSGLNNTYQFTSTGLHTVRYIYSKFDFTPSYGYHRTFENCTSIKFVILPRKIVKLIATSIFQGCTKMQAITYPETIENALMGNYAFSNCQSMERANFRNWDFLKCSWSRPHNNSPLASSTNGGAYYLNGEIIKNVMVPSGITSIGDSLFRNNRALETFQFNGTEARIGAGAFEKCTNLRSIVIPQSVTTIAEFAFYKCTGPTGDFTIPSSVTTIGSNAFQNFSKITNLTIETTGDIAVGALAFTGCGNGAGTFTCNTDLTFSLLTAMNNNNKLGRWKHVVVKGNFDHKSNYEANTGVWETIRVSGNVENSYGTGPVYNDRNQSGSMKFVEVGGTCTRLLVYDVADASQDCILHLGYDGVASTVEYIKPACFAKIYVGDGSSQAHDQAILDQYLADENWTPYAPKLDLWYNYHGEYRQE